MRPQIIIKYAGMSLIMVALMMAISALVGIFSGYDESTTPLLYFSFITLICGAYPLIFVRTDSKINSHEGIAVVVVSWIVCCVFGMVPYICYGGEFTLINAFFESVSGFTTTGASILSDIESLPKGLLFFRVSTAWVGGLGIVSLFSLVIPRSMDSRSVLSSAELSDLTRSQSSKRGKSFVSTILSVYIALTLACTLFLRFAGLGWFDAVTNAMSTCSTCGFCVRNTSIAAYANPAVEIIILLFMVASGISFVLMASYAMGHRRKSRATLVYLIFIAVATLTVTFNLVVSAHETFPHALRLAAFQVGSLTTTTGFATADTTVWPSLSIVVLLAASLICGCAGSTSGGIKMDRIVLMFSYIQKSTHSAISPNRVVGARIDGHIVSDRTVSEAMKFILVYFALVAAGGLLNTLGGLDLQTGLSAAVACIGNVGPGFGSVGSMGNYASFPPILKFTSSLLMIAGRLEIFPLLSLIGILRSR